MRYFKFIILIIIFIINFLFIYSSENNTVFEVKDIKLSLPKSWNIEKIPSNFEKNTVGLFSNTEMQNARILLLRYGGILDYDAVRFKMLMNLQASYPISQAMIKKPKRIKIDGARNARYELWQGTLNAGGNQVSLVSPVLIARVNGSWFIFMGFGGTAVAETLENDFMEIIQTIQ